MVFKKDSLSKAFGVSVEQTLIKLSQIKPIKLYWSQYFFLQQTFEKGAIKCGQL